MMQLIMCGMAYLCKNEHKQKNLPMGLVYQYPQMILVFPKTNRKELAYS